MSRKVTCCNIFLLIALLVGLISLLYLSNNIDHSGYDFNDKMNDFTRINIQNEINIERQTKSKKYDVSLMYDVIKRLRNDMNMDLIQSLLLFKLISFNECDSIIKNNSANEFNMNDIYYGCWNINYNDDNTKIIIAGDSLLSISMGFNYYLNYYLFQSISWTGNNIKPNLGINIDPLPKLDSIHGDIGYQRYQYNYYKNPCTDSYTMSWWDWERWEIELDWMLLNGINLLLLPLINEYIEYTLYTEYYKLTDDDLKEYFVGPAFFAWFRMGYFIIYIILLSIYHI